MRSFNLGDGRTWQLDQVTRYTLFTYRANGFPVTIEAHFTDGSSDQYGDGADDTISDPFSEYDHWGSDRQTVFWFLLAMGDGPGMAQAIDEYTRADRQRELDWQERLAGMHDREMVQTAIRTGGQVFYWDTTAWAYDPGPDQWHHADLQELSV